MNWPGNLGTKTRCRYMPCNIAVVINCACLCTVCREREKGREEACIDMQGGSNVCGSWWDSAKPSKLRFVVLMERSQHWPFVIHHWEKTCVWLSLCKFQCFKSQAPVRRDDGSVVTWGDPSCGGDASAVGSRSESWFSHVQLLSKLETFTTLLLVRFYLVL